MAGGYIKLWRKIKDWGWFDDPPILCFWIYCLTTAAYKPTTYHRETVETGTFIASIRSMSEATGLSEKQIRRALDALTSTGEIEVTTRANQGHLIKVANYAEYQEVDETMRANQGHAEGNTGGHPKGQNIKKRNKERRRKNISPKSPLKGDGEKEDAYERKYDGITYLG